MKNGSIEESLHPRLMKWFGEYIGKPTDVQKKAWRSIRDGENVLVVSPTGSGKTLAAVIPVVDPILKREVDRSLTSIVYISPMKALGADIVKTLNKLSEGLGRIEGKKERKWGRGRRRKDEVLPDAHLKIGIRTGDVPQSERRRMLIDPPDLLVITPENLLLMLCSKARETLTSVSSIIVDEVHEMVPGKRGALLSLTLEMLTDIVKGKGGSEPLRIGLSATVRPESTAARYLGGQHSPAKPRPVKIVKEESKKNMLIEFRTLLNSNERDTEHRERIMDELGKMMIDDKGPLVVFHNTRRSAEEMAYALVQRGHQAVMPHHGSLGADVRKMAEEGLKSGELQAIVSSTSLELGIDIGKVETVCQIASPKDPSKMLQRFGRSGHGLGRTSHGLIYPIDGIDLIESLAVARTASKGKLERLKAPKDPMDVLAQFAIGISLNENGTNLNELWDISRRAYPYRGLKRSDLKDLLNLLSERLPGPNQPPPRLWYDTKQKRFLPRRNTGQAFYLNCGTIPKETSYRVYDERTRRTIGDLSRDFGETLYERDVILLGSKPYRITSFSGSRVFVHEDPDAQPTVPSWSGEVMPRPYTVASEIMNILSKGCGKRNSNTHGVRIELDDKGRGLCGDFIGALSEIQLIPEFTQWPVEILSLSGTRKMYIVILPLGRKVTETLGRVMAYGIRRSIGAKIDYVATDDGFAIISPKELQGRELVAAFGGNDFRNIAKGLVLTSSIFRSRFTHCLNKSLLVLSRFRGKDTGAIYRRNRVENLLGLVMDSWYSEKGWDGTTGSMRGLIVLAEEALKEVFNERIDIEHCSELIEGLSSGNIKMAMTDIDNPSILGKGIIRSWKGILNTKEKERETLPIESISQITHEKLSGDDKIPYSREKEMFHRETISTLLRDMQGIPFTEAEEQEKDLDKEHLLVIGERYIQLSEVEGTIPLIPFDPKKIPAFRREQMLRSGDLGKVIRWMPFFTHPIELIYRSDQIGFHDIRSALRSGKVLPIKAVNTERVTEEEWASIFRLLCSRSDNEDLSILSERKPPAQFIRSEIGELSDLSGDDLTELIGDLSTSNIIGKYPRPIKDLLGESGEGYHLIPPFEMNEDPQEEKMRALDRFLRFFGPFDLNELIRVFGWSWGDIGPVIAEAVDKGSLKFGIGIPGPVSPPRIRCNGTLGIWIWSPSMERDVPTITDDDEMQGEMHLLTHSDPATVLTINRTIWIDKDRIRGANNTVLLALRDSAIEGTITMIETADLIRIKDVEVDDFDNIGMISGLLAKRLIDYERLGYKAFLIERIMGIPSGEAAETSVSVFIENGFRIEDTPKGKVLVKGPEVIKGVTREAMLLEMFRSQGLIEGHHFNHPVEVISKMGSVVDRWEILSRIGSVRYRKLTISDPVPLKEKNDLEWNAVMNVSGGDGPIDEIDWSDIISPWGERLSDIKDLTKRFSLLRGMMDQPYPVWSTNQEFSRYPPPSKGDINSLKNPLKDLLTKLMTMDSGDIIPYLRSNDHRKEIEELLRSGLVLEDGWGEVKPFDPSIRHRMKGSENRVNPVTRGLLQRHWLVRSARRLSVFNIEDLLNYSPGLDDQSKIRFMIKDMIGGSLKQFISFGSGVQVLYTIQGVDLDSIRNAPGPDAFREMIVISPKDRMSRVISYDIRGTIAKGHGFSIFKGGRPIALVSIKKLSRAVKNTEFGDNVQGSSSLEYWSVKKAWVDLRFRRKELLKSIRKAFYSLGCQLLTDDEKIKLESLYRDVEKNKKESS